MLSKSRALCVAALLALAVGPVSMAPAAAQNAPASQIAQATAGQVAGTVTDTSGAPVAGATVSLQGPQTYTATSDAQGNYALANVAPGVYTATVQRAGYQSGSEQNVVVVAGSSQTLNVQLAAPTLSTLQVIGSTRTRFSNTRFNASPASVDIVNTQTFIDQGQPQVKSVLNQVPGLVVSLPATSGNGAAPGAITFPNVRGGLSFETASLIDGHPVSVGAFGDYVTTFLSPYVLQSVEVVKGPGASAPEVNYAIGGTVNFRTLDPTKTPTGYELFGVDGFGGTVTNIGYSDTTGKLGYVFDYAVNGSPGPLSDWQTYAPLNNRWLVNGQPIAGTTFTSPAIPGTNQTHFAGNTVALYGGLPISTTFSNKTELAKLRYALSSTTSITGSFLGSQTWTEQNGNHLYVDPVNFNPGAGYAAAYPGTGPLPGPLNVEDNIFPPAHEWENNNEPIFQGELRTAFGNNNVLLRGYSASISRLQYNGLLSPAQPAVFSTQLYGPVTTCTVALVSGACPAGSSVTTTYTGQNATLTVPGAYFNDSEEDRLHGYSLEIDHPFGDTGNILSVADDWNTSTTGKYQVGTYVPGGSNVATVPPTSGQRFNTLLVRYTGNLGARTNFTFANYFNSYATHYSTTNGASFTDQTFSHYDARLSGTYRLNPNTSLRGALGSAIAPPYIGLYSRVTTAPLTNAAGTYATNTQANPNLRPETAFGYDLGADVRLGRDRQTVFSGDVYYTNLWNQLISTSTYFAGNVTVPGPPVIGGVGTGPLTTMPLYSTGSTNLARARYQGIELAVRRDPTVGFGFTVQGSLQSATALSVPASFYAAAGSTTPIRNLGVIPGPNFYANQGVSNQPIPYSQGYAEVRFRTPGNGVYSLGETYYGPNNSLLVPAFLITNANASFPLGHGFSLNANVDNLFNNQSAAWISEYRGVFQPYVGGAVNAANGQPIYGAQLNANSYGPRNIRLSISKRLEVLK